MASPMVKLISRTLLNAPSKSCPLSVAVRYTSKVKKPKTSYGTTKHRNIIASSCESLAARGFLRSYKPYTPKENVREEVLGFCKKILGSNFDLNEPLSREHKFYLLKTCFEELNHSVPNSLLHKILSAADVIEFYETPVSTTTPYDELLDQELPPNLHIQRDYLRFDPETDVKFKGVTAFPKSSTLVTGIKYKEKYKGFKTKSPYKETEAIVEDLFSK